MWRQAIEGNNQAALLLGNLSQVVVVLALVAGQQRQIDLLIQIAEAWS